MSNLENTLVELIQSEEYIKKLSINDSDISDSGSIIDDNEYLSDEESNNNYTFLQKPSKKQNNKYKQQFNTKIIQRKEELTEEEYSSD